MATSASWTNERGVIDVAWVAHAFIVGVGAGVQGRGWLGHAGKVPGQAFGAVAWAEGEGAQPTQGRGWLAQLCLGREVDWRWRLEVGVEVVKVEWRGKYHGLGFRKGRVYIHVAKY